jgi:hypothetical protein
MRGLHRSGGASFFACRSSLVKKRKVINVSRAVSTAST